MKSRLYFIIAWVLATAACLVNPALPFQETNKASGQGEYHLNGAATRYLAFQIFTRTFDSDALRRNFPPSPEDLHRTVINLRNQIGLVGTDGRRLGFVLGLISFDNSDEAVRALIAEGFDIALETGVAVGFHIDDSMFWSRLTELNTPDNIEWLDWQGTPNTGRRLAWSKKPTKIMPQLCINSEGVRDAVLARATLIGNEIHLGLNRLYAAHADDLFLGVIAGSETQIGRDFDSGQYLGYCALTNAGYSANNPPANIDAARSTIVAEFIELWAKSLGDTGIPRRKIFSHIAYMSSAMYRLGQRANPAAVAAPYLEMVNFTPPATAFCKHCTPGLSTYPQSGHLDQWQEELAKHGNPPWASCEGTAINPGHLAGKGMDMVGYLGNLFNHGAVLVNIYGWGVGDSNNPFRNIAENTNALAAYRKFLGGEALNETPIAAPAIPPTDLADKVQAVQARLPGWIQQNGSAQIKENMEKLKQALKARRFDEAAAAADAILAIIGK
jgi:hypothetical protein